MHTPATSLVWELWHVTRAELLWRLGLTTAALVGFMSLLRLAPPGEAREFGATVALFSLAFVTLPAWVSIGKLNGGRAGFPFHLGYVRPIRTWVLAGVPMAYFAVGAAVLYLAPALVLRMTSGYPFPLAYAAAWLALLWVVQAAGNWWSRSRAVQMTGTMVAVSLIMVSVVNRAHGEELPGNDFLPWRWSTQFTLSLQDVLIIASLAAASVALTLAGVTRQRRGDAWTPDLGGAGSLRIPSVPDVFQVRCPTTTPLAAELWFEMKRTGGPIMAMGVATALSATALLLIGNAVASVRDETRLFAALSPLVVLGLAMGSAFGLRWKQGRWYVSSFDGSCAAGTAQLAWIHVLVRTAGLLVALATVGGTLWVFVPEIAQFFEFALSGFDPWPVQAADVLAVRDGIRATLLVLSIPLLVVALGVAVVQLAAALACLASIRVLVLLHPGRALLVVAVTLLWFAAFALRAPAWEGSDGGVRPETVLGWLEVAIIDAFPWLVTVAIPLLAVYVYRRALVERLLTLRQAGAALSAGTGFLAVWLVLLHATGWQLGGLPAGVAGLTVSSGLLPLTAVALAPCVLGMLRHQ